MADEPQNKAEPPKGAKFSSRRKANVRRPGAVTALEWDHATLRVAQATPRGNKTVVTRVAAAPLSFAPGADLADPNVFGQGLSKALSDLRIRPGMVVLGVPRASVVLRTLFLPRTDDVREMASMVHLQIGKELPFRLEDAVIDFVARPGAAGSAKQPSAESDQNANLAAGSASVPKCEVLVAAVQRDLVHSYQQIAQVAGFKLVALGALAQANARCLEANQASRSALGVALVTLRFSEVGIEIVGQPGLLFSRGASLQATAAAGTSPDTEEKGEGREMAAARKEMALATEAWVEAVTIEVVRALHSYSGLGPELPVERVVVVGTTGREEAVMKALEARLRLPCLGFDFASALELPIEDRPQAADALGALGLGLGVNDPTGLPLDFLHPKRPAVVRNTARIRNLSLAAAAVVVLIASLGIRAHLVKERTKIQRAVQADVTAAEKNRAKFRQMQSQAASIQSWMKEGRNWLEQLAYLSAVLPPCEDVYLTSLSVSGQGNIHLAVQARNGEILANLDRQLRTAGYDVKPLAITPGTDKHGYNFRSTVELILPPKLQIDFAKTSAPVRPADDASLDSKSAKKGGRS